MSLVAPEPSSPDALPIPRLPTWDPRLVLLLAAQTVFGLGWSAYLILPKYLTVELGATPALIGRVGATSGFAAVCAIPLVLWLIDRVPRARLLQAGSGLIVAASLGFLRLEDLGPTVYVLQACIGAAFVMAYNASVTLITEGAPAERLGQTIGWLGAANMTTNALGTAAAEGVAARFGWSWVFLACVAMGVCAFVLASFLQERPIPRAGQAFSPAGSLQGGAAPAVSAERESPRPSSPWQSNKGLLRALFVSALAGVTFTAMFTFIQPFALQRGATEVAPFFLGFTGAAVFVRLFFGSLGDRLGRRRISMMALLVYGVAALATARLSVGFLPLYGAIFGLGHGILYPTLNAHAIESAGTQARGRIVTLFNGLFNVGAASGALIWGYVAGHSGYPLVFVLAGALPFVCFLLLADRSAIQRRRGGIRATPE